MRFLADDGTSHRAEFDDGSGFQRQGDPFMNGPALDVDFSSAARGESSAARRATRRNRSCFDCFQFSYANLD
jgi:hypothetical protein